MKPRHFVYISVTLVAGLVVAFGVTRPKAQTPSQYPSFVVDPSWPDPLPAPVGSDGKSHPWVTGEVAGNCIDRYDNVYSFNRGWEVGATYNGVLQGNESGAIDSQDATASGGTAIPSPPVVVYSSEGKLVAAFGNPSLYQTGVQTGYASYMAQGAHGCFVDYRGNLWVAGNGDGIIQRYNPVTAAAQGAAATYEVQLGTKGMCDGPQTTTNPFSSCGTTGDSDYNSSHTLFNEPADIAVDPLPDPVTGTQGSVYIADGYGNHRVVVYTTADGGKTYTYNRQWGRSCENPSDPQFATSAQASGNQACPPGTFGASGGGHPHCVVFATDGTIYVCDRPNSRIQVFSRSCGAPSTASNPQPMCMPIKIINIGLNVGQTPPTTVPVVGNNAFGPETANILAILSSEMLRACDMDFWPNVDYLADESPTSQKYIDVADANNDNVWLMDKATAKMFGALGRCGFLPCPGHGPAQFSTSHTLANDSKGNIYVAETIDGRRIQKFVPTTSVGLYQ